MANMSYCRFENTLDDLLDCQEALFDEGVENDEDSKYEARARKELVRVCVEIANSYGDLV